MFLGLRTIIYPSKDLIQDKKFWKELLGVDPYFDESFYVGFNIGGYELGLDPNANAEGVQDAITYWGVKDINSTLVELKTKGVQIQGDVQDLGGGIKTARFYDAGEHLIGIIENPNFSAK